jgi:23S rRNA (cytidine1920-2'-O)/16S rRNA (cytidine1409-2'-O)-methyltransferase
MGCDVTSKKVRIDLLLVSHGLASSRSQAQRLVMAGQVRADGQIVQKPSDLIRGEAALEIESRPRYVSRGGEKLEAALQAFQIDLSGYICADVGASTGGFTDCLLQNGAFRVYAIDVGHGILDWKLRNNPAVIVMEETNARYLTSLPEEIALVTIDASFISLKKLLPVVKDWLIPNTGKVIALVKPQFEAGRAEVQRGSGVIRQPQVHSQVLVDILSFALQEGYFVTGLIASPLAGPKGNKEFLAYFTLVPEQEAEINQLIEQVVPENDS